MPKRYVKGGKALDRFLRNAARSSRKPQPTAEAGFVEPHVARLAARLEFGDPRSSLPERPAFRQAKGDALAAGRKVIVDALGKRTREGVFAVGDADAQRAADAMADTIRDSYRTYHGPGLSARQEARKRGSAGHRDRDASLSDTKAKSSLATSGAASAKCSVTRRVLVASPLRSPQAAGQYRSLGCI